MKEHLSKFWGWYLTAAFQAVLIGYKAAGYFPHVTWVGIFIPVGVSLFLIILAAYYQWKDIEEECNKKK